MIHATETKYQFTPDTSQLDSDCSRKKRPPTQDPIKSNHTVTDDSTTRMSSPRQGDKFTDVKRQCHQLSKKPQIAF